MEAGGGRWCQDWMYALRKWISCRPALLLDIAACSRQVVLTLEKNSAESLALVLSKGKRPGLIAPRDLVLDHLSKGVAKPSEG
jgi:hypothetical protein